MLDEVMRIAARGPQLEPSRPLPPGRLERVLELPFGVVDGAGGVEDFCLQTRVLGVVRVLAGFVRDPG